VKVVVVHATGGTDVLSHEDAEPPEPGDGDVLIRVRAASVNPVDWKVRSGLVDRPLPVVLGDDVAGTVELSRAQGFSTGDDVLGWALSGGYAELATARAGEIAHKPDGVRFDHAAAIPMSGLTAWQALFDYGRLERGGTVLIAGAAGGIGHIAIQLARFAGAHVIGTGSSRNRDFVLGLGADEYVDYTREDVAAAARRADVLLDLVGGDTTRSLLQAVRPGAVLAGIAYPPPADWPATEQAARDAGARAEYVMTRARPDQLTRLAELVAAGDMRIELAAVLPLTAARQAHELSESGHTRGKIVLTP
jgi:NADPH:quinone reductase-like Zn-dependent oxidoreductase